MARYRKVSVQVWGDKHFKAASDRGKLAFLYILTHPQMTGIGAMRHTIPGLAAELEWKERDFRDSLSFAITNLMVQVDESAPLIVLPKFLKHNKPESPNVVVGWRENLDVLPECELLTKHLANAKAFTEGLGEGFRQAFRKAFMEAFPELFAKPCRHPLPNQEQEQDLNPPTPLMGGSVVNPDQEPEPDRGGGAERGSKNGGRGGEPQPVKAAVEAELRKAMLRK